MAHDLIVLGGGTAGLGAARAARALDLTPLMVADGPIGGDCTFTGCVPSKTLIAESRRGASFGDAMAKINRVVDHIAATEDAPTLRDEGIEVVEGRGRLVGPTTVEVDGQRYVGDHIIVATGARPRIPTIDGLDDVRYLTTDTLWELNRRPDRLAIIGAGPVGVEMAMAFAGFGTEVTLVEARSRILPDEEPEVSDVLCGVMARHGIDVRLGSAVRSAADARGTLTLTTEQGSVTVDQVLVAAGRAPRTSGLGLEELGVELDRKGHIVVDAKLRTAVKTISAAGDLTGLVPFTHAADEQARLAVAHAVGKGPRWSYAADSTPWAIFTSPEVARVGMTEAEAAASGARVAYLPLEHVDRALTDGRTDGFVKLIAGPKPLTRNAFGGKLLGATIVAERAGEMIHAPAMAHRLAMFVGRLAQVTVPYPTWNTAIQQAAGQFFRPVNGLEARPAQAAR